MLKLLLPCLLVILLSCHKEITVDPDNYTCGQVNVMRLRGLKGATIKYAKQINEYYIFMSVDSIPPQERRVAVFCELPEALKTEGKTVDFDGKFSLLNIRDSVGRDSRLRRFFAPATVNHVGILHLN
jgi:hypothetical protein